MDLNVNVYLTTRKDSLPDLSSYKTEDDFYRWKSEVKSVAFNTREFSGLDEDILADALDYPIIGGYAVIEYPPGEVLTADQQVGEKLKDLFQSNHHAFDWALTRDEKSQPGVYQVSLEIIVDKPDEEAIE